MVVEADNSTIVAELNDGTIVAELNDGTMIVHGCTNDGTMVGHHWPPWWPKPMVTNVVCNKCGSSSLNNT